MIIGIYLYAAGNTPLNTIYVVGAAMPLIEGTFDFTYNGMTTAPLDHALFVNYDPVATVSAILEALENLPNIGPGNIAVHNGGTVPVVLITFVGALGDSWQVLTLTDQNGSASGGVYCQLDEIGMPVGPNQVLAVVFAEPPAWGYWYLSHESERTAPLPANASAADVQAALCALPNIGAGNVSVVGVGTSANPFLVTFQNALGQNPDEWLTADGSELYSGKVSSGSIFGPTASIFGPSIITGNPETKMGD
jgi:hypothetical protein